MTRKVLLSLDDDLYEQLSVRKDAVGGTLSGIMRRALIEYFAKHQGEK